MIPELNHPLIFFFFIHLFVLWLRILGQTYKCKVVNQISQLLFSLQPKRRKLQEVNVNIIMEFSKIRRWPLPPVCLFSMTSVINTFSLSSESGECPMGLFSPMALLDTPSLMKLGRRHNRHLKGLDASLLSSVFLKISFKTVPTEAIYCIAAILRQAKLLFIINLFIFWHVRNFSNWYLQ